jgi:hypothetical protein
MAKEGYGLSFLEKTGLFSDRLFFLTHAARATYPGVVGANALPPGLLSASICRCIASISASSVASFALAGENDPGGTNAALDAALSFLAPPPPGSPVPRAVGRLGGDDDDEKDTGDGVADDEDGGGDDANDTRRAGDGDGAGDDDGDGAGDDDGDDDGDDGSPNPRRSLAGDAGAAVAPATVDVPSSTATDAAADVSMSARRRSISSRNAAFSAASASRSVRASSALVSAALYERTSGWS